MNATAVRLNLTPGTLYRCLLRLGGRAGGLYRVHGLALSFPSKQYQVVYEGMDGMDVGRLFCCTKADFSLKFEPVQEPPPVSLPPAPVERMADFSSKGRY